MGKTMTSPQLDDEGRIKKEKLYSDWGIYTDTNVFSRTPPHRTVIRGLEFESVSDSNSSQSVVRIRFVQSFEFDSISGLNSSQQSLGFKSVSG